MPNFDNNIRAEIYDILIDAGIHDPSSVISRIMDESVSPALEAAYAAGKREANNK